VEVIIRGLASGIDIKKKTPSEWLPEGRKLLGGEAGGFDGGCLYGGSLASDYAYIISAVPEIRRLLHTESQTERQDRQNHRHHYRLHSASFVYTGGRRHKNLYM